MFVASRTIVYSLVAVVVVLLLGIAALLSVAYHRHQRLEDATIDLQRNLSQQEGQIKNLQHQLENCDTIQAFSPSDTVWTWNTNRLVDSASLARQISHPPAERN